MQILDYTAAAEAGPLAVGGKAYNLARMSARGLPAPAGFCVTFGDGAAPTDGELKALRERVRSLGGRSEVARFAVRSSATAEDSTERSFAGLFESFCDLTASGVPDAVLRCRAAMRAGGPAGYGAGGGPGGGAGGGAAVLVQRMIDVRLGGVAFGCDPLTGDPRWVVVEYAAGPVSRVVSGEVTPARVRWRKGKPVRGEEIDNERARDAIMQVVRVVAELEALFECVLDVEWGWDGRRVWLLQARPVTVSRSPDWDRPWLFGYRRSGWHDDPRALWTTANVGEAFPGVITPFSASLVERLFHNVVARFSDRTPFVIRKGDAVFGAVRGRMTLCLSSVLAQVNRIPFQRMSAEYLSRQIGVRIERLPEVACESSTDYVWRGLTQLGGAAVLALRVQGAAESLRRCNVHLARRVKGLDLSRRDDGELARLIEEVTAATAELFFWHCTVSMGSSSFTHLIEDLCGDALAAAGGGLNALLSGLDRVESAAPAEALARLADRFRPLLRGSPVLEQGWEDAVTTLARSPGLRSLAAEIDRFLAHYGYRGVNEAELLSPRWDEQPELIWRTFRMLVKEGGGEPVHGSESGAARAQVARRLSLPKRLAFGWLVGLTRNLLRLRENTRAGVTASAGQLRRLVLEAGRRMAARGVLPSGDDVFYLTHGEILGILARGAPAGREAFTARLFRRRRRRAYWLSRPELPVIFTGAHPGEAPAPAEASDGALRGVPVSCGRAEGRVRVVTAPESVGAFERGDILVAPYLNPGWSPLFTLAGAIVCETGGMMSHGAIIARELGIPAIVGVPGATTVLREGMCVSVDADAGRVDFLP